MPPALGATYAAGAGLLGALAACSAKLALGADYLWAACGAVLGGEETAVEACAWVPMILRVACGALVFVFNAIMWTFFAKALRYSSSSATVTVTSTASNFIFSVSTGLFWKVVVWRNSCPVMVGWNIHFPPGTSVASHCTISTRTANLSEGEKEIECNSF
ncbi:transmembrane protein 42 isoform 1-T1 [Liasis olivaceus]